MQKLVLFNICIYSSTNGKKRKTSTISQERGPGRGRGQGRGRGRGRSQGRSSFSKRL